ncbi:MAG: VTT domain-containing protein [Nocardioides sp.]
MTGPLEAGLALVYGVVSALVPVVNAEAYALVLAGRTHPALAIPMVLALAAGQTVGKLVLFEAARRGSGRLERRFATRSEGRAARWAERIRDSLRSRRTGLPMVLASASLGLPPLAAVSLAAGASGQRHWEFGVVCLVGRTARFALLVLPVVWAFS